jgi:phosphopantetheine adenylyltransferase
MDNIFNLNEIKILILNDETISSENKKLVIKSNIESRVSHLKNFLYDSDYKIIKCYEAFMRQQTLPYNLEELSAQRDAWRAEINELEEELKNL